jgi:hypothetical protein
MKEKELTIEQLIERLGKLVQLSKKLPPEFQSEHKELAALYEKVRRAQSGLRPYPPDGIEGD